MAGEGHPPTPTGVLRAALRELINLQDQMIRAHAHAELTRLPDDLDARLAELTTELRSTGEMLQDRLSRTAPAFSSPGWSSLSVAELAVVHLAAAGYTNRQTAATLALSPHTVGSHLRHAYTKLGINSRVELVHLALANHASADDRSA